MPDIATIDSVTEILKEYYDDTDRQDMVMVNSPPLALLPKATDFVGKSAPLPLMYAPTAGVSPDFGAAQATKNDAYEVSFDITTNDMFSLFSLSHKAVQAARNNAGAFVELVESRADAAFTAYRKIMAHAAYGNGGGALGVVQSGAGGATLTMASATTPTMRVFDRGMQLVGATTDGTSGALALGGPMQIATVNRPGRSMTETSGTWNATAFANGNYVFLRGGFGAYIKGLSAWLPTSAPSATQFFGVDRTVDSRLYGVYRTADGVTDTSLEEFLISLSRQVADEGGEPDLVFCSTRFMSQLVKQLGNKVTYGRMEATRSNGDEARFGFKTVKLIVETGEIDIVSDYNCPANRVYMLQRNTWKWWSMGEMVDFLRYGDDDREYARHNSENAMEGRIGGYMQLCCKAPGFNGVGDVTNLIEAA